ncbi:MAG: phenylalanine--tRNA ligase subunit beta, partial [Nanoarchaeota archaeon]|nr:phenylalanine--tRNA ligase subunit beta [Nanoarchaeota archaeon]
MANVKFPRKEFELELGKTITPELEEKIALFGTPVESLSDSEIELEIFPNRPDMLSMQGFLRAFKAFLGNKNSTGLKKYQIKKSKNRLNVDKSLPKEWPYAYACIVRNLSLDNKKIKDIIQLQEKLGSTVLRNRKKGGIGLYPLEKIKFPITFKGLPPEKIKFQPLEFPTKLTGRQILSKHPTGREYAFICESWKTFPVFIDKSGNFMSMPPIINSHEFGKISESTKDVFIEATGNSPKDLKTSINIIATTLADMGGKIESIECVQQNKKKEDIPDLSPEKLSISLKNINFTLGLELTEKQLSSLLSKMGLEYSKNSVKIPRWRSDILHEVDIAEDVAIAYGYGNFVPKIPSVSTSGSESIESKIKSRISELLIGLGLIGTSSYHLIKQNEAKLFSLSELEKIETLDSKTEYKILRPNLLIPTLRILSEN